MIRLTFLVFITFRNITLFGKRDYLNLGGSLNQVGRITSNPSENPDLYYSVDGSFSFSSTTFLNTGN
ncbi:MAG: hypothetical protein CM15mP83_2210 [Flavobacteriaceae bacterium]|nr:MAG: hypothetical protein CM15mP83_2210 [Flavobacteriaceae bacterium]